MKHTLCLLALALGSATAGAQSPAPAPAATTTKTPAASTAKAAPAAKPPRDEFFWLGEINKATAVINTEQGLLDKALAPNVAAGVAQVIEAGNQPGGKRPSSVITFEPLMIKPPVRMSRCCTPGAPARTCTRPIAPPSCARTC